MLFGSLSERPEARGWEPLSQKRALVVRERQLRQRDRVDYGILIERARFAVIDLETTGLRPRGGDAILSVGGVRITGGRVHIRDRFFSYVNPERPIPPETIRIHRIVPSMVNEAPALGSVLRRFLSWCGGDVLVGHHIGMDLAFLDRGLARWAGARLLNPSVDVARLAQTLAEAENSSHLPDHTSFTLEALAARQRIPIDGRHTALGDALTTAGIFLALVSGLRPQGIRTVGELLSAGGVKRPVRPLWKRFVSRTRKVKR